jgi:hypothetical protein
MDKQDLEATLMRTIASMTALEGVLVAIFDRLPMEARRGVLDSFVLGEQRAADLIHFEPFSDQHLAEFQEAHNKLRAILSQSLPDSRHE